MKFPARLLLIFLLILVFSNCSVAPKTTSPQNSREGLITTVPFTLHDNRILVDVMLNDQGPFTMIFDTGGGNTITPSVQRKLNLPSQGIDMVGGAGTHQVRAGSVRLRSVKTGGLTLNDQRFMVINLSKIRRTFRFPKLDGVIGIELLRRARVRVDFDLQVLHVYKPDLPGIVAPGAELIKFELVGDKPVVDGQINGHPARIMLDTGDRSNLTLFRKFATKTQLNELFDHREILVTGIGIGGPIHGKINLLNKVNLGPVSVSDILARLPLTKGGAFYHSNLSASAGLGLLREFNMDFDYQRNVVILERRKDFKESSSFVPVKRL